ncbi:hypothetical protein K5549_020527, partial [Capra hircus]|uniref:Uncharacterized protein n=1 Tax=Capra hircus TaxID=9925 RepID=A0A452G2T3_CAPHI
TFMSPDNTNPPGNPHLQGRATLQTPRAPAASSGVRFPEATDLLGALRLSGYACGARVMAAVRGAAAKTKRSTRTASAPRSEGSQSLHAAPQSITRLEHSSPARGPVRPAQRSLASPPQSQAPWGPPAQHSPACARPCPGVCVPARRGGGAGARGVGTPARHLPSSLSSTIISGAPCPAAARLGREKGADSGRASAGRPVLGQRADSNYPLVRLLT